MENMEGIEKGDVCNRDGCAGIIHQHEREEGCSCHINPPCNSCTNPREYCPECDWDAAEEMREIESERSKRYSEVDQKHYEDQNRKWNEERDRFNKLFTSNDPVDEFDYRKESHTHSSMRIRGVYPGDNLTPEMLAKISGTFGGRFERKGNGRFVYISYTD